MKSSKSVKSMLMLSAVFLLVLSVGAENISDILPKRLVNAQKKRVSVEELEGKIIGLYFSASWCPPCRSFSPLLVKFRNDNQENFEVVFVSSDRSDKDQIKYMKDYEMPWLAVPQKARETRKLQEKFEVRGIPKLVILDGKGTVLSANGVAEVRSNPDGALAAWKAKISD